MAPKAAKAPVTCNWVPSIVTKSKLAEFVKSGHLPKKEVLKLDRDAAKLKTGPVGMFILPVHVKKFPEQKQTWLLLPLNPTIRKIKALLGNGLNDIDLVRVWVTWRILPGHIWLSKSHHQPVEKVKGS